MKLSQGYYKESEKTSRTSHEVRGLKSDHNTAHLRLTPRRTSHEVRGLKFSVEPLANNKLLSHLTRGAWIEIQALKTLLKDQPRRTSHEVRGLKYNPQTGEMLTIRRTSHEVRGLKFLDGMGGI